MARQKAENVTLHNYLNEANGSILKEQQFRSNDEVF